MNVEWHVYIRQHESRTVNNIMARLTGHGSSVIRPGFVAALELRII